MIVVCETEAHVCEYYKCHYVLRSRRIPPCRDIEHWRHPYMNSVPLLQYDCEGCMLIARCRVIVTIALFVHARVQFTVTGSFSFLVTCFFAFCHLQYFPFLFFLPHTIEHVFVLHERLYLFSP